jgi:hypothetical protein
MKRSQSARRLVLFLACSVLTGCTVGLGGTTNNNTNNNSGPCDAEGENNSVNCSSAQAGSTPAATTANTAPAANTVPDGKQVGSYPVILSDGYHVPIGPKRPTASQITATGVGDLVYSTFSGVTSLSPITPYSEIAPFGSAPTYQGCMDDTNKQPSVGASPGSAFCLYEQGLIVGGVVTYIDPHAINPDSVTVQITVWSDASSSGAVP